MQVPPWAPGWTGTLKMRFSHWDAWLPNPQPVSPGAPLQGRFVVHRPAGARAREAALAAARTTLRESATKYVEEAAAWAQAASPAAPADGDNQQHATMSSPCRHSSTASAHEPAKHLEQSKSLIVTATALVAAHAAKAAQVLASTWQSVMDLVSSQHVIQPSLLTEPGSIQPTANRASLDRKLLSAPGTSQSQRAVKDAAWRGVVPTHTVLLFEVRSVSCTCTSVCSKGWLGGCQFRGAQGIPKRQSLSPTGLLTTPLSTCS
jgi:hypothetical protein